VQRDDGRKIISSATSESLDSGAREKRWNIARGHTGLCSFSFSGRMAGHSAEREKKKKEKNKPRAAHAARVKKRRRAMAQ
jgi:hypothetical protein